MITLALDSATPRASIAITRDGGSLARTDTDGERTHSETLFRAIAETLDRAKLSFSDIDLLAVGLGPGAFTALRVGLTAIKTLSYVRSLPLVGISTLDVLAYGLFFRNATDSGAIVPMLDAKRGEVYTTRFEIQENGRLTRTGEYRAITHRDFITTLTESEVLVGSGVDVLGGEIPAGVRVAPRVWWDPDAEVLSRLAVEKFEASGGDDPARVLPLYIRRSDAEIHWEKKMEGFN